MKERRFASSEERSKEFERRTTEAIKAKHPHLKCPLCSGSDTWCAGVRRYLLGELIHRKPRLSFGDGVSAQRVRVLIRNGRLKATPVGVPPRVTYLIDTCALLAVMVRKTGRPPKKKPATKKSKPTSNRKSK